MRKGPVLCGEPFYLGVADFNNDGTIYNFDVDGHPGSFAYEASAITAAREQAEDNGCRTFIYRCVAVARVEPVPRSKVTKIRAKTEGQP